MRCRRFLLISARSRSPSCHLTLETTLARVRRNIAALSCFQLRFGYALPLAELPPHPPADPRSRSAQHRSAFLLSVAIRLCTPARRAATLRSRRRSLAFGATSQRFPAFSCDSARRSRAAEQPPRARRNSAALCPGFEAVAAL